MAFFLLVTLTVTGVILFLYYSVDIKEAYSSLSTDDRFSIKSVLRGVHRHGGDLLVILVAAHMARAVISGRAMRGGGAPWAFGMGLMAFTLWQGVTGYALPMDDRSVGVISHALPCLETLIGHQGPSAFMVTEEITSRTMILLLAAHLAPPIIAVVLLAGHFKRLATPRLWPGRGMMAACVAGLALAALIAPATSFSKGDFQRLPGAMEFDWLLMAPLAWIPQTPSALFMWLTALGAIAICSAPAVMVWRVKRKPVLVIGNRCVGCGLCAKDCPYEAILMEPRPADDKWPWLATVTESKCEACGVCVGSCGFWAMDLPSNPTETIRSATEGFKNTDAGALAYVCNKLYGGQEWLEVDGLKVKLIPVACAGQVYPGLVELALKENARFAMVARCASFTCDGRLGSDYAHDRLFHARKPFLKKRVDRGRVALIALEPGEKDKLPAAIADTAREMMTGVKPYGAGVKRQIVVTLTAIMLAAALVGLDRLWAALPMELETGSTTRLILHYETMDGGTIRVFQGAKPLALLEIPPAAGFEPSGIYKVFDLPSGDKSARVTVTSGGKTSEVVTKSGLVRGESAIIRRNPVTGKLEAVLPLR
ncbi:MAG: hydrogenase iron-sulfur subunit [Nitrospinae bacterium]|nr:hydrogenase iron-sulfur subunit [Nitrospinota bacterium]